MRCPRGACGAAGGETIRRRGEETLFLLEVVASGRDVGFGNNDRIVGDLRPQRDWVAPSGHSDRLRINGRSAVLADHTVRTLVEAKRAADFAGIEQRGDFAIGLLIKPEAHFNTTLVCLVAMQLTVVDVF